MKKLSVIIPVYNVEEYLEECLNSVCNQTLTDIEIICVNDGATDNSGEILHTFAKKDKRIQVIEQENAGLSAARNTGLKYATGEYITFLDSDDWISLDYYETLYKSAKENDADIAVGNVLNYINAAKMSFSHAFKYSFTDTKHIITEYQDKQMLLQSCVVWHKLYKRSLIFDNRLQFYHGKMVEDFPFTFMAVALANKIVRCPFTFLYYRQRETSIMGDPKKQVKNAWDVMDNYKTLKKQLELTKLDNKDFYFDTLCIFMLTQLVNWISKLPKMYRREYINQVSQLIRSIEKKHFFSDSLYWNLVTCVMHNRILNKIFYIKYTLYKVEFLFLGIPLIRFKNSEEKDFIVALFGIIPVCKIRGNKDETLAD